MRVLEQSVLRSDGAALATADNVTEGGRDLLRLPSAQLLPVRGVHEGRGSVGAHVQHYAVAGHGESGNVLAPALMLGAVPPLAPVDGSVLPALNVPYRVEREVVRVLVR